jgi:predicted DNA-binding antitoxin AbrB/MazE fold protein
MDDVILQVMSPNSELAVKQDVQAIFENGVLRPLEQLVLTENEQVGITVHSGDDDWLDAEALALAAAEGDVTTNVATVREQLSRIRGSLAEAVIAERGEY